MSDSKCQSYVYLTGLIAALAYVFHVVLGGILWPGYNHFLQAISDLTGAGAPNRYLLEGILRVYNVGTLVFGFFAFMYFHKRAWKLASLSMILFLCMQILTMLYPLFPQEAGGGIETFAGLMHLVLTAILVPFTIAAPFCLAFGLRGKESWQFFSRFSLVCGILIFVFGGLSGFFFAQKLSGFGLVERLNLGTLQLWTALLSLSIFFKVKESKSGRR